MNGDGEQEQPRIKAKRRHVGIAPVIAEIATVGVLVMASVMFVRGGAFDSSDPASSPTPTVSMSHSPVASPASSGPVPRPSHGTASPASPTASPALPLTQLPTETGQGTEDGYWEDTAPVGNQDGGGSAVTGGDGQQVVTPGQAQPSEASGSPGEGGEDPGQNAGDDGGNPGEGGEDPEQNPGDAGGNNDDTPPLSGTSQGG